MEEGGCKAVFTASCNVEMQYTNNYVIFGDINAYVQELLILIQDDTWIDIEFHYYLECTINLPSHTLHNMYAMILPILGTSGRGSAL